MDSKDIVFIDAAVCQDYLLQEFGDRDYSTLGKGEKDDVKVITTLIEFIKSGTIQPRKEVTDFEGPVGQQMISYLSYKTSQRLAKQTINEYEQHLFRFLCYLKESNVISIKSVNQLHIINYIKSIDPQTISLAHTSIRSLRDFFKYLYRKEIIDMDLSSMMPKDNYKAQANMPSTYTAEEIQKLISSVDRISAVGKRDYAIILLAARLGLRASDIANLKFENVLWEQSLIRLTQYKTGSMIELPILPEIGNSLVEYLKFGRLESEEPFVFLCARSPYNPIHTSVITQIVRNTFAKTEINTKYRKHGPHALRHSLAGRLLERQTILPVISEILGHENTESTRFYLRIDLTSLRQCVLEVPAVSPGFYAQKGGLFYE
jgi:site-specific recombinase XerD